MAAGDTPRRTTALGIPYSLMGGYPKITATRDEVKATEKYRIRAQYVSAFIVESFPPPVVTLNRLTIPNARTLPGSNVMFTKTVSFEPLSSDRPGDPFSVDNNAAEGTYEEYYIATIEYATQLPDSDTNEDSIFEHSVNVGGEFMSLPAQKTELEDDGGVNGTAETSEPNKDIQLPLTQVVPTIEHDFRVRYVLNPNWEKFVELLGCVNSNSPNNNKLVGIPKAKRETVMFMGVSGSQKVVWTGTNTKEEPWDLEFKFSERSITDENGGGPYGWNHFYIPAKGKYLRVKKADGTNVHKVTDLNPIFEETSTEADT